jgi:hypothetical protein
MARHDAESDLSWSGGAADVFGGPAIDGGAMHHVVGVSEHGRSVRLWVDGALAATGEAPALADDSDMLLHIGANQQAPGREWEGRIDDVAIWSRALSRREIAMIWNGGAGASIGDLLSGTTVVLTGASLAGGSFRLSAEGLAPARTYALHVNADESGGFVQVAGSPPFTGGESHTFVDPSPRSGTALYVIREVAP